jgi:hypothetical protein
MKQIIAIVIFLFLTLPAFAQGSKTKSFEGTIKYSIDIAGPEAGVLMNNKPCTKMDMHFKDNNFIIHTHEGQFPLTRLYIADSSELYILDMTNEVAYRRDKLESLNTEIKPPKAIATGDSAFVLNIKCAIYRVQKKGEYIFYYVTDLYRIDPTLFEGKKDAQVNFLTLGLDGRIPLKTVRKTAALIVTTQADQVIPRKLEVSQFRIPANFIIKPRDNRL